MEFFLSLYPQHLAQCLPHRARVENLFVKNTIFSEFSHTLAKIMVNVIAAHAALELLLIVMMLPRKWCGAASFTLARKHSSEASWQAAAGIKPKAVWVINSHTVLFPLPTLQDHRSQPLGSEES